MKKEFKPDKKYAAKERRYSYVAGIVLSIALGTWAATWLAEKFGFSDYWPLLAIPLAVLLFFIDIKFVMSKPLNSMIIEEKSLTLHFKNEQPQIYDYQDVEVILFLTVKYGIKVTGRNLKLNAPAENNRLLLDLDLDSYFPIEEINSILNTLSEYTTVIEKKSSDGGR